MLKYNTQQEEQTHPPATSHSEYKPPDRQEGIVASPTGEKRADFSMNTVIGWILQGGVLISAAVIGIGLLLLLLHAGQQSSQQVFVFPHTLRQVGSGLLVLQPQAFVALGLLLLIATPVVRVAASIIAFALEHDWRYVAITCVVLAVLLLSFLLGKGAG
jgi:uncharacterized membrane protein